MDRAVEALKAGAEDYLSKPFDLDEIVWRVNRIEERRTTERALESARAELRGMASGNIIGRSPSICRLLEMLDTIAESDAPVLIAGETGTGKGAGGAPDSRAQPAARRPLRGGELRRVPRDAARGGAVRTRGRRLYRSREAAGGPLVAANGGTLLLDEVGEIPPLAQAKLLRVLQEGTIEPLGTNDPVKVDVRVLSATHRDLKERISEGLFREDLYYRLNVLDVSIPPLRDRTGDLPILVQYFLERFSRNKTPPTISPRAWAALSNHPFYGNVRELEHAIQRAVVLGRGAEGAGCGYAGHLAQEPVGEVQVAGDRGVEAARSRPEFMLAAAR